MRALPAALALAARLCAAPEPDPLDLAAQAYAQGRLEQALKSLDAAAAAKSPDARLPLLRGMTLLRLQRHAEALAPLRRALALDPSSPDAALNLGLGLFHGGQWGEAEAVLKRASQAHAGLAGPWLGLGMLEAGRGRWDEARQALERAVQLDPASSPARLALSDALLKLGRPRAAAEAREAGLGLAGADPEGALKLAALWYGLGEWDKAAQSLERAASGEKPEALYLKGCLFYRQGDFEAAERHFRAAMEARPEFSEAELNFGLAAFGREDYELARQRFEALSRRRPGLRAASDYGRAARDMAVNRLLREGGQAVLDQDFSKALESWDKALEMAEDKRTLRKLVDSLRHEQKPRAAAMASAALLEFKAGRLEQALAGWHAALRLDPGCEGAKAGLAEAGRELGRLSQAYERSFAASLQAGDFGAGADWAARIAEIDKNAGKDAAARLERSRIQALKGLEDAAESEAASGRLREAHLKFEEALRLDPLSPRLQARLVRSRGALRRAASTRLAKAAEAEAGGDLKGALQKAEEALALEPGDPEANAASERLAQRLKLKREGKAKVKDWYYEGVYLYGAGRTREALEVWRRALDADPGHALVRQALRTAELKLRTLAELEARR